MVKFNIYFKSLLLFSFLFFISSCVTEKEKNGFLKFDTIEHYHKEISEEEVFRLYDSQNKSDSAYFQLITTNTPDKLDKDFKQKLQQFGYKKKNLSLTKMDSLIIVLNETKCQEETAYGCLPIYRDILFLFQDGELVGMTKIAIECHQVYFVGANIKKDNLGLCKKDYDFFEY